jgi:dephospho-CoA kinase
MTPTAEDLLRTGPILLFLLAVAETSVPAGLLAPAGVALATGAFLAHGGYMPWEGVLAAAAAGALVGDSLGFWLGRRGSFVLHRLPGLLGRLYARAQLRAALLFRSHALAAVTGGRLVSFVRTLMPPTAGVSGISYPRFLLFDVPGVAGWLLLYVALGVGTSEGARVLQVEGASGRGLALVVGVGLLVVLLVWRRRRRLRRSGAFRVGLTGNVASGKSTVARVWAGMGVPVVSADELAREVVEPGTPGLAAVVEAFGSDVLAGDGLLDRAALRKRVFREPSERERLEAILHPRIRERRAGWEAARLAEGHRIVVSEIPLLFEADLASDFDRVVVVHASPDERRRRLVEERGLAPEEADRIMASQGDPEEKRRRADHVLMNEGSREELEAGAQRLMKRLRREARR